MKIYVKFVQIETCKIQHEKQTSFNHNKLNIYILSIVVHKLILSVVLILC